MTGAREVGRGDRDGVLTVLRDAFDSDDEARLVEQLWASNLALTERLIEIDRNIIAYAAISPVEIRIGDGTASQSLGLAPVAVSKTRQRQGLGTTVVDATILAAFEKYPNRLLFVLGDPRYYRRFGFMPASPLGFLWEGGDVGDAFQVRTKDGLPQPISAIYYGSHDPHPARVHYCSAFQIFGEASK